MHAHIDRLAFKRLSLNRKIYNRGFSIYIYVCIWNNYYILKVVLLSRYHSCRSLTPLHQYLSYQWVSSGFSLNLSVSSKFYYFHDPAQLLQESEASSLHSINSWNNYILQYTILLNIAFINEFSNFNFDDSCILSSHPGTLFCVHWLYHMEI